MDLELRQKVISAANAVRLQRYSDAEVVYAAGSFIRGDATAYSDLDLVVIYRRLPNAYRESFRFEDIPVEAFVHDPETLNYFFLEVDRPSGVPALIQMVVEGVEVPVPNAVSQSLKELATSVINMGPPELTAEERQKLRYGITDLIDDIRDPRSYEELVAAGSRLYEAMANYYLRRNGMWSASGKSIPRALARADQDLSAKFNRSFQHLFQQGDPATAIDLASGILLADGGFLFDGHRGEAPASWRKPLPRMLTAELGSQEGDNHQADSARSLMFITKRPDVTFVRGQGSWLYDAQGRPYLDFLQGWAVNSLGHSPRLVRDALAAQAARVINVSPQYYNEPMCRLANLLARLSGLDRVFFANSGAEANEGAIKLARRWGSVKRSGSYEIIVFDGAFHGRTLATMSASGKPQWKDLFEPKVPGFIRVPPEDLTAVRKAIGPKTAAVMLEPIQGESGVHPFSREFLKGLRELTQELGVLLILDEIQTGIGRTGRVFCFEHAKIQPDVMTLGKGIGGGVPLAALLAREEVSVFEAGDQGGTFNGNPLMTAVGCAVVEEISRPDFLKSVRETAEYLTTQLRTLSRDLELGDVRGLGLLLALDLGREIGPKVVEAALAQGLLINSPRPTTLRFVPALNVTRAEIDQMTAILREAIQSVTNL